MNGARRLTHNECRRKALTAARRPAAATIAAVRIHLCVLALLALAGAVAEAAPFLPSADSQVLATVPARASDPRAREMLALRQAWQAQPQNVDAAVRLAQRYFDEVAAEGDPRYVGHAQAVLQPWWAQAAPPAPVRVLRAKLAQFDHRFDDALADLDAVLREQPDQGDAWAWRTAILMVRADYAEARRGCQQLQRLASALIGAACMAQVQAVTGQAAAAAAGLRAALQAAAGSAEPAERLWALTRLAETEERRGEYAAAEAAFREALALGIADVYLQAAYADFLLDRGRAGEVLVLLKDAGRADVLLLRLALAAKLQNDPRARTLADEMAARFEAARQHGDTTHRKEESRFVLALRSDVPRALALAKQNWAQQREPADARILLEAALAAHDQAAAQPVLDWMGASGIESQALQRLALALKGVR